MSDEPGAAPPGTPIDASPSIDEDLVSQVVSEVSERMRDPRYGQVAIGTFVQAQPELSRFLTAHADELGGPEGVVHAVFHAQVLAECFRRSRGEPLPVVGFTLLDETHSKDPMRELQRREPFVASYVASNVDDPKAQHLLAHVGLALERVP